MSEHLSASTVFMYLIIASPFFSLETRRETQCPPLRSMAYSCAVPPLLRDKNAANFIIMVFNRTVGMRFISLPILIADFSGLSSATPLCFRCRRWRHAKWRGLHHHCQSEAVFTDSLPNTSIYTPIPSLGERWQSKKCHHVAMFPHRQRGGQICIFFFFLGSQWRMHGQ